jgi:hypothetical protein
MSKVFKAVGKAVSSVVKAVVKVASSVVKAVVNVASTVLDFVISPFMGLLGGMPKIPDYNESANQQAQGVQLQYTGSTNAIPIAYGLRKLGGKISFVETGSTDNKYMYVSYIFSEGPVEGIYKLFIDDVELDLSIPASLNAGRTVDVTTGKYAGRIQFQWYPGVYFSDPKTSPIGVNSILKDAPSWKPTMVYNGLAVLFARYEWKKVTTQAEADANPFTGNIPVVQIELLGRKIQSLLPNSGTSSAAYGANERYSTNPAEILFDYLRNPRYGKGLALSEIDFTSFSFAAVKCNQQVEYVPGKYGPILTFNGVIETSNTLFNNTKIILQQMRGYLPYVQGKYKLKIEDAGSDTDILSGVATIVATFNKDNIQGDVTYQGIDRTAKYNQVTVTYVDPDQGYSNQQVTFPETEAQRQLFITEDGGRENKLEITMPAITNYAIAKDFARLLFNKSRYQESCSLVVSSQGFELEPGDSIYIQSKILNFADIPWRVVSLKYNENYTFELGCVRNPDFIYPHTRVGEADIVLPTFIPKGAFIYYPPTTTKQVGLIPPSRAIATSGGSISPITNPDPSDPVANVSIGGGIGGVTSGNNWINTGSTNSNGTAGNSTSSTTTTPGPREIVIPLRDTLDITNIEYIVENGLTFARLSTKQPTLASYSHFQFFYKRAVTSETVWTLLQVTERPGAGSTITFKIGPLIPNTIYNYRTLVYYGVDTRSEYFAVGQFRVGAAGTSEVPSDTQQVYASAWTTPDTQRPTSSRRDDYFSTIQGSITIQDAIGATRANQSTINFTVTQEINANPVNWDVAGFKVWVRNSNATFWTEYTETPSNYVPGLGYNWTVGLAPPDTDPAVTYEFIFRILYKNGDLSSQQHYFNSVKPLVGTIVDTIGSQTGTTLTVTSRLSASFIQPNSFIYAPGGTANVRIISQLTGSTGSTGTYQMSASQTLANGTSIRFIDRNSYPINPIYGKLGREAVSNRTIEITPPGFTGVNANVVVGINSIEHKEGSAPGIRLFYQPPSVNDRNNWRGIRLRYRKVSQPSDGKFTQYDYTNRTIKTGGNGQSEVGPLERPIELFEPYEYVLTYLFTPDNGATVVEGNNSLYMLGTISPYLSQDWYAKAIPNARIGEWKQSFNIQTMLTSTALNTINAALPTIDAQIQIAGCKVINLPQFYQNGVPLFDNGSAYVLGRYLELEFSHQHIAGYQQLEVYRRANVPDTNIRTYLGQTLRYQGVGRWEKVSITRTNNSGNVIVNLRGPTDPFEFGYLFGGTYRPVAGATPPQVEWSYVTETGIKPYAGLGTTGYNRTSTTAQEFLFVVRTIGGLSSTGLRVFITNGGSVTATSVDQLVGTRPAQVLVSSYESYDAGFLRNLSEARTTLPADKLAHIQQPQRPKFGDTKRLAYPTPLRGPSIDT